MKQFDFTYWYGPTEDYILKPGIMEDVVDCGFSVAQMWFSVEGNQKALARAKELGLKATLEDVRLRPLVKSNDFSAVDPTVRQIAEDYKDYDNLIGIHIYDEPIRSELPIIAAIAEAFRKYLPGTEAIVNLFPNYASVGGIGYTSYREYVEDFIKTIKPSMISFDHYNFYYEGEETVSRWEFFQNMEIIREVAYQYSVDPMFITLMTQHFGYVNLSRGNIRWEVNMGLVYGMRRISFYTYWLYVGKDYRNPMCDEFGNRQQHWYDVQDVIKETKAMGEYLFDRKTVEVLHVGKQEAGTRPFAPFGGIKSVDGDDLVIGFFDDGSIYLVNRKFGAENTVALRSEKGLEIWKDGKFVPYEDGQKIELQAGAAVLLKSL